MRELRGVPHRMREEGAPVAARAPPHKNVYRTHGPSRLLQLPPNRQFTEILDCSDACAVTNCKEVPPPPSPVPTSTAIECCTSKKRFKSRACRL